MSCSEMKELEAGFTIYAERRQVVSLPRSERRMVSIGRDRAGHARMAYVMQMHRQNCHECRE
jgi:hypothetical protein